MGEPHRPGIVHRLDRGTSGLLVVGPDAGGLPRLVEALSARRVTRRYQALVWGVPEAAHGIIDAPIGRSPRHPTRMAVVADGKEARTRYEVRDRYREPVVCSLLDCQLETGRTHQIRVHLAASATPSSATATTAAPATASRSPAVPPRRPPGLRPPGQLANRWRSPRRSRPT